MSGLGDLSFGVAGFCYSVSSTSSTTGALSETLTSSSLTGGGEGVLYLGVFYLGGSTTRGVISGAYLVLLDSVQR